jgi:probable rRNA maturation factor
LSTRLAINVSSPAAKGAASVAPFLKKHLRKIHRLLHPKLAAIDVLLVNDRSMKQLHTQFMGLCSTTDVLTFPVDLDARGRTLYGEIAVCVPEARRRARERKVSLEKELLLYTLHGMLHLCGFDDKTARGFAEMHRAEDRLLTRIGVGPVFDPKVSAKTAARSKPTNRPRTVRPGRPRRNKR